MELNTKLLACKKISNDAYKMLRNARCEILKDVPGLDDGIEIVELQYAGYDDLNMMSVWGTPREIQIHSRNIYLVCNYEKDIDGLSLITMDEAMQAPATSTSTEDGLGPLDGHPF
jgi:hypothetical protein